MLPLGVFVDVTAGLDIINNKAFWIFQAIDTATLLPTTVAEAGFLPVNDSINHRGEGFVNFTIKPIGSAVTGDTLIKQASIVFDINEAMTTNTWKNTIDALPPVSMVNPLPSTSLTATIPIGLSGADDTGGCGIQKYALYYSQNNGPFHLYKEFETGSNATFTGETGSYYRFFSIASDHVGNTEAMKTLAEAFITIDTCAHIQVSANIQQPTCSYNADGSIALSISGGIPPYTYSWGNEIQQTEDSIFNLGTGTYIVTVTDENRCSETDTFAILAPQILFGNAGPDEVISFGTFIELITLVTGGTQPYTYLWQPGTGLDQVNIPDPVASPSVTTQYQLVTTDVNGCISYDTVVVNVIPAGGIMVSGHLTYNNTFQTPMNYAPIKLYKNDSLFAETVSNLAGYYQFPGLFGGNYRLEGNTSKPSGGINATDALLTLLHFAGIQHLQSFPLKAADVNGSGSLNAVDALLILNRFVGTIETFPAGDWLFENPSFTVNNAENITLNFKTLCYGDPNGSYIPGLKTEPSVRLQYEGEMMVREGEEITIPFRIDRDIEPAAISLVITPEAKPVFDSLNASFYPSFKKGILAFNQVNNQLRLAWYGKEATILKSGAIILYLKTQANNQNLNQWLLGTECQLADDQGNIIQNVTLKVPFIRMTEESCWLGDNIPNPAGNSCIIPFYLNGESRVVLTLYDITGHEVKTLLDASLPAGNQQVETDCRSFSAGVYLYKLEVSNNKTWFLKTKRMVIGR
ncbi:MAG: T9SS type A sorting domain-containing protein [Bacteroidetes bacterium]|nr:T9SS type A sorting domain-containing protein [Bacteroidota bacterium]